MQNLPNVSLIPTRPVPHANVNPNTRRSIRPVVLPQRLVKWVTIAQIVKRLEVTTLAVNKWREGSSIREPLASMTRQTGKANRVLIKESDLLSWLRRYRDDLVGKWYDT